MSIYAEQGKNKIETDLLLYGTQENICESARTVSERLKETVDSAIQNGYRRFITGGATGFDTLSAQAVLNAKQEHKRKKIKLILAIPCPEQADGWEQADIDVYEHIKILADSVVYVSTHNKKRLYAREKSLYG